MSDDKHSLNVPVTIKQVCNNREGQPDVKVWGGRALQRCKVALADGREASVRIGAAGLKPGDEIVLVDMRSWPNTHKPGQFVHAADNARTPAGAPIPALQAPAAQAAAPSSIPGAAPAPTIATEVPPQKMLDGLAAFGAEIVKVTKAAFLDGRGSGCATDEFAVVYGCSHKAGREEGLLRKFVEGWRPEAEGGPPRDSDEPPLSDPNELPQDDDIPF